MQDVPSINMQEKMMANPSMMTDMFKKQLTGTAPHLAMGFLVNQFFAGFIMGKVPFSLSPRFRSMLQRGIDMSSLDVSYFTSLSFYILLLFGLRGVLSLIFQGDVIDDAAAMKQSMGGASPAFDAKSEFKGEKQRFELVRCTLPPDTLVPVVKRVLSLLHVVTPAALANAQNRFVALLHRVCAVSGQCAPC